MSKWLIEATMCGKIRWLQSVDGRRSNWVRDANLAMQFDSEELALAFVKENCIRKYKVTEHLFI